MTSRWVLEGFHPGHVATSCPLSARLLCDVHVQVTLLTQHLVRVLRVASSLQVLDAGSFAIQVLSKRAPQQLPLYPQGIPRRFTTMTGSGDNKFT